MLLLEAHDWEEYKKSTDNWDEDVKVVFVGTFSFYASRPSRLDDDVSCAGQSHFSHLHDALDTRLGVCSSHYMLKERTLSMLPAAIAIGSSQTRTQTCSLPRYR